MHLTCTFYPILYDGVDYHIYNYLSGQMSMKKPILNLIYFLFSTIYLYEGTNYNIPISNLNNKTYNFFFSDICKCNYSIKLVGRIFTRILQVV